MARINPPSGGGVVVFDAGFTADALNAGAQVSQAGPASGEAVPGSPELLQGVPQAFGEQDTEIESVVIRPGPSSNTPVLGGCQLAYRKEGGEWKGWNYAWNVDAVTAPLEPNLQNIHLVSDPDTGLVYVLATPTLGTGQLWSWDAHNGTLTLLHTDSTIEDVAAWWWGGDGRLMGVESDGPVLVLDIETGDFTIAGAANVSLTVHQAAAKSPNTDQVLFIAYTNGTSSNIETHGSYDNGASWSKRAIESLDVDEFIALCGLRSGGFAAVYVDGATNDLMCARLGDCQASLVTAAKVTVQTNTAFDSIAVCEDEAGILWVYGAEYSLGKTGLKCFCSTDGGLTWEAPIGHPTTLATGATGSIVPASAASGNGCIALAAYTERSSTPNDEWRLLKMGGWDTITLQTQYPGGAFNRHGFAGYWAPLVVECETYFAEDLPDTRTAYTLFGTGAGPSLGGVNGPYLRFQPGASTTDYYRADPTNDDDITIFMQVEWSGADFQVLNAYMEGAVNAYLFRVYLEDGGTNVRLFGPSSGQVDVPITSGNDAFIVLNLKKSGFASAWVRDGHDGEYEEVVSTAGLIATSNIGLGTHRLEWGIVSNDASARTLDVKAFHYVVDDIISTGTPTSLNNRSRRFSGPIAKRFIPDMGTGAGLELRSGVAQVLEQFTHPVAYEYSLSAALEAPQRSKRWRSTSKSLAILIDITLDKARDINGVWALALIDCNFRTATLQYHDGTSFVDMGEADLGTTVGKWALAGNTIRSRENVGALSSTATYDRHLHLNEFAGGHFIGNGMTDAYEIESNTAGKWNTHQEDTTPIPSPNDAVKKDGVRAVLVGDPSGEPTTGTSGVLVAKSGICLIPIQGYPTSATRFRIVIDANQDSPWDYYEAGAIKVGRLHAWGAETDWSVQDSLLQAQRITRNREGRIHAVEKLGEPRHRWTIEWSQGALLHELRSDETGGDYISPDDTVHAIGHPEDVAWVVHGLLQAGGVAPVVAVANIPTGTDVVTYTDPSMWLYGWFHVDKDVDTTMFAGKEGQDEALRIASITIEEVD